MYRLTHGFKRYTGNIFILWLPGLQTVLSWSCLLSFLCNPYIPFLIYDNFHLLVSIHFLLLSAVTVKECNNFFLFFTSIVILIKVQNPRRNKCSAVVELETNCLVAEYRILHRFGPCTIITYAHRAPLIDGLGHATWSEY